MSAHTTDHDLQAHADCAASRTYAYLRAAGLAPPDKRVTSQYVDDQTGWQVVVTFARWEGPPRVWLNPGVTLGEPAPANSPPARSPLRDIEATTLEAAPLADAKPVSVRQLARRAGYRDSGHFREAVAQLIDRGLLVRVRGGVRRAN